jgi:hypothetical protein
MRFGGADNVNMQFAIHLKDVFAYVAGNIDVLGGLSAQSETLGQDKLLSDNASELVRDMQARVYEFTQGVLSDVGWYMWEDPNIDLPMTRRIEQANVDVFQRFNQEAKRGEFLAYNIQIEPFSMQPKSPAERLGTIQNLVQTTIIPLAQLLEMQGMTFDFQAFLKLVSRYGNLPEVTEIIRSTGREQTEQEGPVQTPRQSPVTTRNTVRRNVATGGTRASRDMQTIQALSHIGAGGGANGRP